MTASSSLWSDLPRRLATIVLGFPLVLGVLLTFPRLFFLGVHLLCSLEWMRLQQLSVSDFVVFTSCSLSITYSPLEFTQLTLLLSFCLIYLYHFPQPSAHCLFGLVLISLPMQAWHHLSTAFQPTVSLLLVVWNCDTGALVAGRLSTSLLQRRIPVAEAIQRVSPKKSMEGIMGGLLLGSLTTIFMPWWWRYLDSMGLLVFDQDIWNRHTIPWGLVLSSCAILGDLVESAVKRVSKSKDSSRLLPGHGGILDRFDSSFVAVLVYRLFVMPT